MKTPKEPYGDYVVFVESKSLRARSKKEYLRQIRKLADRHPRRRLDRLKERDVFDHLIHLRDSEHLRPSTLNQALVSLRMFYRDFLGLDWKLWREFTIRRDRPLPLVLTRKDVRAVLAACRENRFKAVLALIYHCGLRVGEAVRIRPQDIDAGRGVIRIIDGKGGKNREVPIAPRMIAKLRGYWKFHRNPQWLFPGVGRGWKERSCTLQAAMQVAAKPMSVSSVQAALRTIVPAARIHKNATCHTLRHSFATHLLEDGVTIRQVSNYLGHSCLTSTLIYLHVTDHRQPGGCGGDCRRQPRMGETSGSERVKSAKAKDATCRPRCSIRFSPTSQPPGTCVSQTSWRRTGLPM